MEPKRLKKGEEFSYNESFEVRDNRSGDIEFHHPRISGCFCIEDDLLLVAWQDPWDGELPSQEEIDNILSAVLGRQVRRYDISDGQGRNSAVVMTPKERAEHVRKVLTLPVGKIDLPLRVVKALLGARIDYVWELCRMTEAEVRHIHGIGTWGLRMIWRAILDQFAGLSLGMQREEIRKLLRE